MSVLVSLLIMGQGIVGAQGRPAPATLDGNYDRRHEITFSGTVAGKTKAKVPGMAEGMSILVRSSKTVREVELGPAWYVSRQSASVVLGEKVKVTGVPLIIDKREKVVLARQIVHGKKILALRDESGNAYWTARRDRVTSAGRGTAYRGTIGSMTTFNMNGQAYSGYVLNTQNGPVNVALAPSWYWENQPSTVNVGDSVTLYGNGPVNNVNGVILANSFEYGGGTFVFDAGGGYSVYDGERGVNNLRPFGNGGSVTNSIHRLGG